MAPRGGSPLRATTQRRLGYSGSCQPARLGGAQLRANLRQHGEIIRRFETVDEEQRLGVALGQHVAQLKRAIGGIDGHQHDAQPGSRQLQDDPLRHVGGPKGHVVAAFQTEGQQSPGGFIDLLGQLAIGEPKAELREDDGVAIAVAAGRLVEHLADGQPIDPGKRLRRVHLECDAAGQAAVLPSIVNAPAAAWEARFFSSVAA